LHRFSSIFGSHKALIAMAHVPALPGTPLYDSALGMQGIIDAVGRDVEVLVEAGFDAVLFCNENDRPYQLSAEPFSAAAMARVVTALAPTSIPFGADFLWDADTAFAIAAATGAAFMRTTATGVWESDMGLWQPDAAKLLRQRRSFDRDDLAILMNITPEFASSVGTRTPAQVARSVAVSSLADAILVSGPMAGDQPDTETVRSVRDAVPHDVPVLLNTGAKAETIGEFLKVADGCIVGSSLKVDGHTWNTVDRDRAMRFVDAARKSS
jgi:membrane complex biogenesis BtpA family protein